MSNYMAKHFFKSILILLLHSCAFQAIAMQINIPKKPKNDSLLRSSDDEGVEVQIPTRVKSPIFKGQDLPNGYRKSNSAPNPIDLKYVEGMMRGELDAPSFEFFGYLRGGLENVCKQFFVEQKQKTGNCSNMLQIAANSKDPRFADLTSVAKRSLELCKKADDGGALRAVGTTIASSFYKPFSPAKRVNPYAQAMAEEAQRKAGGLQKTVGWGLNFLGTGGSYVGLFAGIIGAIPMGGLGIAIFSVLSALPITTTVLSYFGLDLESSVYGWYDWLINAPNIFSLMGGPLKQGVAKLATSVTTAAAVALVFEGLMLGGISGFFAAFSGAISGGLAGLLTFKAMRYFGFSPFTSLLTACLSSLLTLIFIRYILKTYYKKRELLKKEQMKAKKLSLKKDDVGYYSFENGCKVYAKLKK